MTSHSYFVVMIDYARPCPDKDGPSGLEAIVDPEITRREVVSRIVSGEYRDISFIHWVHDGICEDVTEEIVSEARAGMLEAAE